MTTQWAYRQHLFRPPIPPYGLTDMRNLKAIKVGAYCKISYFCNMNAVKLLNNYPLLRIVAVLIPGIIAGDAWGRAVPLWLQVAVATGALGIGLSVFRKQEHLQGTAIMTCVLVLGAAIATHQNRLASPKLPRRPLSYHAVVASEPQQHGQTLRLDLIVTQAGKKVLNRPLHVKAGILKDSATLRWRHLHLGDGIEAISLLEAPHNFYAGSHFDYARWLRTQGFAAQTFIYHRNWQKAAISTAPLSRFDRFRLRMLRLRTICLEHYRRLGLDHEQYAVVAAMTLGDKSHLSRQLKDCYSVTGASHVLALSGLHLGIIYAVLSLLPGRSKRWRWLSQGLILAGIWGYAVLVGLPASAVRSATMLSVCSLCTLLNRRRASINTLAFAALVMLVANPHNLWDIGFQMSFMAVLAILVYYRPLYYLLPLQNAITRGLWGLTVVSLAAQIGTAPLVMYYFGRFSCYFLLTNFVAIPVTTLILYAAVAMAITTPILPLQQLIAVVTGHLASLLNASLACLTRLPGASIEGIHINTLQLYLIYIVTLSLTVLAHYAMKIRHQKRLDAFYKE